jgi:hypothetical protein
MVTDEVTERQAPLDVTRSSQRSYVGIRSDVSEGKGILGMPLSEKEALQEIDDAIEKESKARLANSLAYRHLASLTRKGRCFT